MEERMLIKKPFYWTCIVVIMANLCSAQQLGISGRVRDKNTHDEIPFVNVFIKGAETGTVSDYAGKFSLHVDKEKPDAVFVFQHVAYYKREIPLDSVKAMRIVYLQPRVIPLQSITIEAPGRAALEIKKDLPQPVALLDAKNFSIRGYVDAGDFLRTDHSVQVSEELTGKKSIALRGGNADEVLVLYNGIKMNPTFDGVFDFSLIDLEDISRFEVIKGSNTALYGTGGLSGVINIIPKLEQDYHIRFQQRVGSYRSGNWGIHLYQPLGRLRVASSYKRGATRRQFAGASGEDDQLINQSEHYTANLVYRLSNNANKGAGNYLTCSYTHSALDYDNSRDLERISDLNRLATAAYQGSLLGLDGFKFTGSFHRLDDRFSASAFSQATLKSSERKVLNDAHFFSAEKLTSTSWFDFLLAYQTESTRLEFFDEQNLDTAVDLELRRRQHGFVAIAKLHAPSGSESLQYLDFDVSVRHDRVQDYPEDLAPLDSVATALSLSDRRWRETTVKSATRLIYAKNDLTLNAYLNFGKNVKFPTLFQQISRPLFSDLPSTNAALSPEKNDSIEIGSELTRNIQGRPEVSGWRLTFNYFKSYYQNKIRSFYSPGTLTAGFDNVSNAQISGIESKSSFFFLQKKVTLDLGISRYFISEKAAFPFKFDMKYTADLKVDHLGYAFQVHLFREGEQVGWIRQTIDSILEVSLPARTDLDIHLGKSFEVYKLKILTNASGRNLLNSRTELAGLVLQDRRFYLTCGVQY